MFAGAAYEVPLVGVVNVIVGEGLFGTVPAVVIGGIGTLTVVALWMGLFPPLRRVDRFSDVAVR